MTLLSYPSDQSNLLSLCEHSSRYELYFAGRFRVLDFILSMGLSLGVDEITLLEPDFYRTLEDFASEENTGLLFPPITVCHVEKAPTIPGPFVLKLAEESESEYFIIINGDNPLIGDLRGVVEQSLEQRVPARVITLGFEETPEHSTRILLIHRDELIKSIRELKGDIISYCQLFKEIVKKITGNEKPGPRDINGYFRRVSNIVEYFDANMDLTRHLKGLLSLIHLTPLGNLIPPGRKDGLISKNASVTSSILSDGCEIYGEVLNSVLFPNVKVGKKSRVENSIILPNTNIGDKTLLTQCVVDETFDLELIKKDILSISEESIIGREDMFCRNTIYPNAIYNGITLIGPNCSLPKKIKVGAGCYVKGGSNKNLLRRNDVIKDCGTV